MSPLSPEIKKELIAKATGAMKLAYCPYSKYEVGAALLTSDDKIVTGGNVENASYGGTICAERSAVCRAVAEGHRSFKAVVVVTHSPKPASPCGLCRQFLFEFGNFHVILASTKTDETVETTIGELLPGGFGPHSMEEFNKTLTN
uniref:Cytidine deaminase n=1 Tax=Panagrellus redivivus TaxID=6233 RepID=A0A7E4W884_PANRE